MKEDILQGTVDFVTLESITWKNDFIVVVMLSCDGASSVAASSRGVPDLLPTCDRMDIWGLSEVAKALCGAACIEYQERPVCSFSRCAPGVEGGIGCAL